jgi:hypothetical protein
MSTGMTITELPVTLPDTSAGPSQALWRDCPVQQFQLDPGSGYHKFERWLEYGPITAVTTDASLVGLPYYGFNSSGGTHTYVASNEGGIVCTEATDNEASYIRAANWPVQVSAGKGDLWFEARVKVSAITDNQIGFIMGLWDNTAASVIVPLSTANPPVLATTGNFVGFWGPEEDAGGVNFVYKADGVTMVTVQSAAHQFVADTYVKLGMKLEINGRNGSNRLTCFVNGVEKAGYVTVPDNTGTTFPADVAMGFLMGLRLGAATSSLATCQWYRLAQRYRV